VISDGTNAVVATINTLYNPFYLAYDSAKGEIFVADAGANTIQVISDNTYVVIANLTLPAGSSPYGLAYDSGSHKVFCTSGSSTVSVISENNNAVIENVSVGYRPQGLVYDAAKGEVFVANNDDGTVSVISDSPSTSALPSPTSPSIAGSNPILSAEVVYFAAILVVVAVIAVVVFVIKRKKRLYNVKG
jgi:YVTN family beta-propeller protein